MILYIFSCENCHTLMNAEPCVQQCNLHKSGLPGVQPEHCGASKVCPHLLAAVHCTHPSPYLFTPSSISPSLAASALESLCLPLSPPFQYRVIWPIFWSLPFSSPLHTTHTSFSTTEPLSQAKREQRIFPPWKARGAYNCRYSLLYIIFS